MEVQTPDWVKHAVFYQIFPDRFARGKQSHSKLNSKLIDPESLEDWEAPPTLQGYKGGDLWGILENLDYIQDLGVNAIYFTPIFQSASNHRYHTHDYYQVDPILGGNEAFSEFLQAAHQRDIKVVLDGVFNHASRGFFFFNDILENGPHSPWLDWFRIEGWSLAPYTGEKPANYRGWAGNRALPVFNHDNPYAREYIMKIAEYWIEFGIDGWRLDVPFEITVAGFWQEFRERVKAINPEAYIVGEVWTDSTQWLDGTQFDGVMNYLFTGPTIALCGGDRVKKEYVQGRDYETYPALTPGQYGDKMKALLQLYPWEIQLTQLNLLASHDTARLLTIAGDDISTVKLATLLLLTFPGAPSIYYGDEVGLPGGIDPDSRRGFPAPESWDRDILKLHKDLISLRNAYECLRIGKYQVLFSNETVYVFKRSWEEEELIIAANIGDSSTQVSIDVSDSIQLPQKLIYADNNIEWEVNVDSKHLQVSIPARSGFIWG